MEATGRAEDAVKKRSGHQNVQKTASQVELENSQYFNVLQVKRTLWRQSGKSFQGFKNVDCYMYVYTFGALALLNLTFLVPDDVLTAEHALLRLPLLHHLRIYTEKMFRKQRDNHDVAACSYIRPNVSDGETGEVGRLMIARINRLRDVWSTPSELFQTKKRRGSFSWLLTIRPWLYDATWIHRSRNSGNEQPCLWQWPYRRQN